MSVERHCVVCGAQLDGLARFLTCDRVCARAHGFQRTRTEQLAVEMDSYRPGAYADKAFEEPLRLDPPAPDREEWGEESDEGIDD